MAYEFMVSAYSKLHLPAPLKRFTWPINSYAHRFFRLMAKQPLSDFPSGFGALRQQIAKDDTVIEVGANVGGLTLELSKLCKHVYSFEPSPYSFKQLSLAVKSRENVTVFNAAGAARTGEACLNMDWNCSGSNSLYRVRDKGQTIHYSRRISVKTYALDDLKVHASVIVLDCEGAELDVLKGAESTLRKAKKIFIETHIREDGVNTLPLVISALQSSGYGTRVEQDYGGYPWVIASAKDR